MGREPDMAREPNSRSNLHYAQTALHVYVLAATHIDGWDVKLQINKVTCMLLFSDDVYCKEYNTCGQKVTNVFTDFLPP